MQMYTMNVQSSLPIVNTKVGYLTFACEVGQGTQWTSQVLGGEPSCSTLPQSSSKSMHEESSCHNLQIVTPLELQIRYPAYKIWKLQFIMIKLVVKQQRNTFMIGVTITRGTVLKSMSIRKAENQCRVLAQHSQSYKLDFQHHINQR